jgi:uncharacterized SAM-binding protein YcdF (DUF218 family)
MLTRLIAAGTSPYFLALLALFVGVVLLWTRRDRAAGRIVVTVGAGLLFFIGWAPAADRALRGLEYRHAPVLDAAALPDSAWVVVLGGGVVADLRLPPLSWLTEASLARLAEGIRLHRASDGSGLVVSGAALREIVSTASAMAAAAVSLGVDPSALVVHDTPRNTAEEADRVRALADGRPIVVVTSASHMPRAVRLFEARGLEVIPAPTHYLAPDRGHRSFDVTRLIPRGENIRKVERAVYELLAGARRR